MSIQDERFSRSVLIQGYDLKRNAGTTVAIVGAGALGSWVGQALAGFGLKKIIIIDPDLVEIHNLSRQLPFTNDDVGENKAFALKERIEERIPLDSTIVEASEEYVNRDNIDIEIPEDVDIAFLCVDNARTRLIVNDYLVKQGIPFINGGTTEGIEGEVSFVQPGVTPCLRCYFPDPDTIESGNCSDNPDPSIVGNSMVIASLMVFQFQQWITGRNTIPSVLKFNGDRVEPEDRTIDVNDAVNLDGDFVSKETTKATIPAPFYFVKMGIRKDCICQEK